MIFVSFKENMLKNRLQSNWMLMVYSDHLDMAIEKALAEDELSVPAKIAINGQIVPHDKRRMFLCQILSLDFERFHSALQTIFTNSDYLRDLIMKDDKGNYKVNVLSYQVTLLGVKL